jgi:hypothetical protein
MTQVPTEQRRSSRVAQRLGGLLGVVWFTFLATSDAERPTWLRIAYAVTALVFAIGTTVELAGAVKRWHRGRQDS